MSTNYLVETDYAKHVLQSIPYSGRVTSRIDRTSKRKQPTINYFSSDAGIKTHVLAVEPGELVLESLMKMIEEAGIRNGAVVSGIGTLDYCYLHMVTPTGNVFPDWKEVRWNWCRCRA